MKKFEKIQRRITFSRQSRRAKGGQHGWPLGDHAGGPAGQDQAAWPARAPPLDVPSSINSLQPQNTRNGQIFCQLQYRAAAIMKTNLERYFGTLPEWGIVVEAIYTSTSASMMLCEQFILGLRVRGSSQMVMSPPCSSIHRSRELSIMIEIHMM